MRNILSPCDNETAELLLYISSKLKLQQNCSILTVFFCSSYCCFYFSTLRSGAYLSIVFAFLSIPSVKILIEFLKKKFLNELIEIIALSNIIKCNCDLL